MINFRKPKKIDISGLIKLSKEYSLESRWGHLIPVGQIYHIEEAKQNLLGNKIYECRIAEKEGNMIGYIAVKNHKKCYEASILVDSDYRKQGIGKELTDIAFKNIPSDVEVEAWVADFNKTSLKATPKMGFEFKRKVFETNFITDKNFYIHIFSRSGDLQKRDD